MPRRRLVIIGVLVALVAVVVALLLALRGPAPVARQDVQVDGTPEAGGSPVAIDTSLFLPDSAGPSPAVVLAHGFGGSKDALTTQAERLAREGFVVASYTARGFGASGGSIHLNSPDYEVADASRVLDLLATRPEVQLDGAGDPRVAVIGASYGGALALLLAGNDDRVDSIIPMITWNNLERSLFPQHAARSTDIVTPAGFTPIDTTGVFRRLWAGSLFSSGGDGTGCGRFDLRLCAGYAAAARTGDLPAPVRAVLARSSPASVLAKIQAPTMLVQGEADSLFPLSEADANAAGIAATGTPVKSVWVTGGHDTGFDPADDRIAGLVLDWLNQTLRSSAVPQTTFEADVPRSVRTRGDRDRGTLSVTAPGLPGTEGQPTTPTTTVGVGGDPVTITAPAGGTPATISGIPGLDALTGALAAAGTAVDQAEVLSPPGQSAVFESEPLPSPLRIVGAPRTRVSVRSSADDALLFASLQIVTADGRSALPQRLVAPLRVDAKVAEVDIALPAIVRDIPAGARLRLVVSSTDAAYALPLDPRTYTISLAEPAAVELPLALDAAAGGGTQTTGTRFPVAAIAAAVALTIALGLAGALLMRRRRRRSDPGVPDGLPVEVRGLGKAYGDGFRAVDDLSFTVGPGQVLGLLGPNGAGKTTTLRMLLGLIQPSEGEIRVFGERIEPGASVLHRVGAMVEGPGLLPHVSGLGNLRAYWRATGRPDAEARYDIALQIAGLGDDVARRVGTYSHGMRQRLAIAQAMLGLPDLLVLDEPTNGLDPPQIVEMRQVVRSYAATGRTVVLSSHLLAEVEATCTHIVVMARGRLVASGAVAEVVGTAATVTVDVSDPVAAERIARDLPGSADVRRTPAGLLLRLPGTTRGELVRALVAAGIDVDRVATQHSLEEAFLSLVDEPAGSGEVESRDAAEVIR